MMNIKVTWLLVLLLLVPAGLVSAQSPKGKNYTNRLFKLL